VVRTTYGWFDSRLAAGEGDGVAGVSPFLRPAVQNAITEYKHTYKHAQPPHNTRAPNTYKKSIHNTHTTHLTGQAPPLERRSEHKHKIVDSKAQRNTSKQKLAHSSIITHAQHICAQHANTPDTNTHADTKKQTPHAHTHTYTHTHTPQRQHSHKQ
jgi:hypothetical protein